MPQDIGLALGPPVADEVADGRGARLKADLLDRSVLGFEVIYDALRIIGWNYQAGWCPRALQKEQRLQLGTELSRYECVRACID